MSRRRSKGQKYEKPPRRAVFGGGRFVAARTSTFDQQAKRITPPELAVIIIISTTSLSLGFPCPCSPLLPAHSSKRIERLSAWHASADAIKASLDEPYPPPRRIALLVRHFFRCVKRSKAPVKCSTHEPVPRIINGFASESIPAVAQPAPRILIPPHQQLDAPGGSASTRDGSERGASA